MSCGGSRRAAGALLAHVMAEAAESSSSVRPSDIENLSVLVDTECFLMSAIALLFKEASGLHGGNQPLIAVTGGRGIDKSLAQTSLICN